MRHWLIRINNLWSRRRMTRMASADLLMLVPHCLQRDECERKVLADPDRCARCDLCDLGSLLRLRDQYGFALRVAAGGRQAITAVREPSVRGVVAIACPKELTAGILAAFPKPVLAIVNRCPCGPCRNTRVCLDETARALEELNLHKRPPTGIKQTPEANS